jgi:hypothetical protein
MDDTFKSPIRFFFEVAGTGVHAHLLTEVPVAGTAVAVLSPAQARLALSAGTVARAA